MFCSRMLFKLDMVDEIVHMVLVFEDKLDQNAYLKKSPFKSGQNLFTWFS